MLYKEIQSNRLNYQFRILLFHNLPWRVTLTPIQNGVRSAEFND